MANQPIVDEINDKLRYYKPSSTSSFQLLPSFGLTILQLTDEDREPVNISDRMSVKEMKTILIGIKMGIEVMI